MNINQHIAVGSGIWIVVFLFMVVKISTIYTGDIDKVRPKVTGGYAKAEARLAAEQKNVHQSASGS